MSTEPTSPSTTGSENVISDYYDGVKEQQKKGYETTIKKSRTALFVVAGLVFLAEMVQATALPGGISALAVGIALIEAGIFIALGFWTKKKPFSAILIGLILFLLMWVGSIALTDASAIYKGIVIRIIVIVYLASGLKAAKAWEQAQKN